MPDQIRTEYTLEKYTPANDTWWVVSTHSDCEALKSAMRLVEQQEGIGAGLRVVQHQTSVLLMQRPLP